MPHQKPPPRRTKQGAPDAPSHGLLMAGEGSRFLEAASAVGRKACPEVPKIDPADPPLTTSQPINRRARLACTRPSSLKRPTALKSKAVLGRASHRKQASKAYISAESKIPNPTSPPHEAGCLRRTKPRSLHGPLAVTVSQGSFRSRLDF